MRDELIEQAILQTLHNRDCGAKERTLRNEVAIRLDRPLMPLTDFEDALNRLDDREAVKREVTELGTPLWGITSLGRQMMTEEGWL